jgi:hypothetical protein
MLHLPRAPTRCSQSQSHANSCIAGWDSIRGRVPTALQATFTLQSLRATRDSIDISNAPVPTNVPTGATTRLFQRLHPRGSAELTDVEAALLAQGNVSDHIESGHAPRSFSTTAEAVPLESVPVLEPTPSTLAIAQEGAQQGTSSQGLSFWCVRCWPTVSRVTRGQCHRFSCAAHCAMYTEPGVCAGAETAGTAWLPFK